MCRDKGLKAAVNFQLRFSPKMMLARQAIAAGRIGQPLKIEVHLSIFTPWTLFPFLWTMHRVEILVHSVHYLDSIRALFATPSGVFARSLPDPRAPVCPDPHVGSARLGRSAAWGGQHKSQPSGRAAVSIGVVPD